MRVLFSDDREDPSLSALDRDEVESLATLTLAGEGFPDALEVSIVLIDEAPMTVLNGTHMGESGPTDVLSFPLESLSPGVAPEPVDGGPTLLIGDIFICPAVVAGNAAKTGVAFRDEMALMIVHGLLHLLGYDHVVDSEAEQMEQRERDLLAKVGRVRP
ncbi:MAG: rRNA maturation RNase YbeY [bacterium]|nr:rRNA maturation RNase YbeY [bacterium]